MNKTTSLTARILLAVVGIVAALGIGSVAYGATAHPSDVPTVDVAGTEVDDTAEEASAVPTTGTELSAAEADGIVFMVEEEKLARDVYSTLGDIWGVPIFDKIASAEQIHMDAVLSLVSAYGLADPSSGMAAGEFVDPELQTLYDDLVTTGSRSLEDALEVGAVVEEVDIEDLYDYLAEASKPDVTAVYERLLSGSENHLRAFVTQLNANGVDRDPVVLDSDTYESILAATPDRGHRGGEQGRGPGSPQGNGRGHSA